MYRFEYNQLEISRYRSGSWTVLSFSDIQWDKRETIYIDRTGAETDSYRYRLYNSVSAEYSDYSPTIAGTGFTRNQVGYMVREVRKILGDEERRIIKTDDEIIRQFNRAQEIIQSKRQDWWFLLREDTVACTSSTKKYAISTSTSDFNFMHSVRFRFNDGTTDVIYDLLNKPLIEHHYDVRDNNAATDDYPSSYSILPADSSETIGYVELDVAITTGSEGTLYYLYYKDMSELDDVADSTDVPIPSLLEDFALEYGFRLKGDDVRADLYQKRFYGPEAGPQENVAPATGIRLLERMQTNKMKALGQPSQLISFKGRKAMSNLFANRTVDRDSLAERYF